MALEYGNISLFFLSSSMNLERRGNASNYTECLMVEECTINVGFHSNFGTFRQSGNSKTPLRLAIINGMPFNPTYNP